MDFTIKFEGDDAIEAQSMFLNMIEQRKKYLESELRAINEASKQIVSHAVQQHNTPVKKAAAKATGEKKERASFPELSANIRQVMADGIPHNIESIATALISVYPETQQKEQFRKLRNNVQAFLTKEVLTDKVMKKVDMEGKKFYQKAS